MGANDFLVQVTVDEGNLDKQLRSMQKLLISLTKQSAIIDRMSDAGTDLSKHHSKISSTLDKSLKESIKDNKSGKILSKVAKERVKISKFNEKSIEQAVKFDTKTADLEAARSSLLGNRHKTLSGMIGKSKQIFSVESKIEKLRKDRRRLSDSGASTAALDKQLAQLDQLRRYGTTSSGKAVRKLGDTMDAALASPSSTLSGMVSKSVGAAGSVVAGFSDPFGITKAVGAAAQVAADSIQTYADISIQGYNIIANMMGGMSEALIQHSEGATSVSADFDNFKGNLSTMVEAVTDLNNSMDDLSGMMSSFGNAGDRFIGNFLDNMLSATSEDLEKVKSDISQLTGISAMLGANLGAVSNLMSSYSKKLNTTFDDQLDMFEEVALSAKFNTALSLDDYTSTLLDLSSRSSRYNNFLDESNRMLFALSKTGKLTDEELKGVVQAVEESRGAVEDNFSIIAASFTEDDWSSLKTEFIAQSDGSDITRAEIDSLISAMSQGTGFNSENISKLTSMMSGQKAYDLIFKAAGPVLGKNLSNMSINGVDDIYDTFADMQSRGVISQKLSTQMSNQLAALYDGSVNNIGDLLKRLSKPPLKKKDLKKASDNFYKAVSTIKESNLTADELVTRKLGKIYIESGVNIEGVVKKITKGTKLLNKFSKKDSELSENKVKMIARTEEGVQEHWVKPTEVKGWLSKNHAIEEIGSGVSDKFKRSYAGQVVDFRKRRAEGTMTDEAKQKYSDFWSRGKVEAFEEEVNVYVNGKE